MRRGIAAVLLLFAGTFSACGGDAATNEQRLIHYSTNAERRSTEVYEAGGLTIQAECRESNGKPNLSLAATTEGDDTWLASEFETEGGPPGGFRFVREDFDADAGAYDFLGSGVEGATGKLTYVNADGGHVSIDFVADRTTGEADCLFNGLATYAEE